jgi:hypothetical protein
LVALVGVADVVPSLIANEDIFAATLVKAACSIADGGVVIARDVGEKGTGTAGGVVNALGVAIEGSGAAGGVVNARDVGEKGTGTAGGVVNALGVAIEGSGAAGGVVMAGGEISKSVCSK